ncbi:MAG: hypothetical protein ACE5HB_01055 [Terriglobia bacterium]
MNCNEFDNIAGEVLEGENHPEALAHLGACARCRRLVDDLNALERAARQLPVYQPSHRLWARLQAAATEEGLFRQPSGWYWLGPVWTWLPARTALASAAGLLLALGIGLVAVNTPEIPLSEIEPQTPFEIAQGERVLDADYTSRYATHLDQVQTDVLGEPTNAELRGMVERPLNVVARAIAQTQARLDEYPDDYQAREELNRLYRQKADVLQTVVADAAWYEASYSD